MKEKKFTVLIGVTSSIAAYKTLDIVKRLLQQNINVEITMTSHAKEMIDPGEFEKITQKKVYSDIFTKDFDYKEVLTSQNIDHIQLAKHADLFVIVPATANVIAKLSHGIADDFLTTTVLAYTKRLLIAPAMNVNMWNHPQTKENIARLKTQGVTIIEPTEGMLACGDKGKGKLENVDVIFEEIQRQLSASTKLQGKKVIVTAGGTTEPIDSVRVITNNSSGKMGSAIAEELYLQGADVLLLKSKQAVSPRYPIAEKTFVTSNDLHNLLKQFVPNYQTIFHAAAVSDFSIQSRKDKLPSDKIQTLTLLPQRKIVEEIKILNPKMQLFAFKAVYGKNSLKKKAKEKLLSSHADAVIANDISEGRGFEKDENAVLVVTRTKSKEFSLKPKKQLAKEIIDFLL